MGILELAPQEEQEWDDYVRKSEKSTFYHQIGWRNVIENAYGWRSCYLIAKENAKIVGILPLFLVRVVPFARALVSIPFSSYGGICADEDRIENALFTEAKDIARGFGVRHIELRNRRKSSIDLATSDQYVTSDLKLDSDPEAIFKNLKKNKRRNIKKSQKRDLTVEWGTENLGEFYRVYSHNMRDLGTPVHSYSFFEHITLEFPESSNMLVVKRNEDILYGSLVLFFKDTCISGWSSTLQRYRKYYPTDFGIWNAIVYCCQNGYKHYDFARSLRESTNLEFKERWGAETKQLYYQYYLSEPGSIPRLNPSDLKVKCFTWGWKRLPVCIANALGPSLRRYIS